MDTRVHMPTNGDLFKFYLFCNTFLEVDIPLFPFKYKLLLDSLDSLNFNRSIVLCLIIILFKFRFVYMDKANNVSFILRSKLISKEIGKIIVIPMIFEYLSCD